MNYKAPEKIYLVPFGKPIIEPLPQEGSLADTIWSSKPYANSNAGNIEYTRTDVFIEKACEWIKCNWREHVWTDADGVIHFGLWENDFRKAMED